jgi:membrane-bound metal-dependent hydrolase YbcI (DUF457 family)
VTSRWIGRWLFGVGVLHSLLGLIVFAATLRALVGTGRLNVLGSRDPLPALAFWFLFGGVFICLVGYLIDWIERLPGTVLPRPWAGRCSSPRRWACWWRPSRASGSPSRPRSASSSSGVERPTAARPLTSSGREHAVPRRARVERRPCLLYG